VNRGGRGVFLIGALIGVIGGIALGSAATLSIGDKVSQLSRHLLDRLFDEGETIHFELLGQ